MRRIDVIAAHGGDVAQASFDAEVVLKDTRVFLTDLQERRDSFIWDVISEIARGNRRSESTHLEIFNFPVVDLGLVDFSEQIVLIGVDAV